jgi:hypothetical protein
VNPIEKALQFVASRRIDGEEVGGSALKIGARIMELLAVLRAGSVCLDEGDFLENAEDLCRFSFPPWRPERKAKGRAWGAAFSNRE